MIRKPTCTLVAYGKSPGETRWTHEMEFINTFTITNIPPNHHLAQVVREDGSITFAIEKTITKKRKTKP